MTASPWGALRRAGGVSFLAGAALAASLVPLVALPDLRGPGTAVFLSYYFDTNPSIISRGPQSASSFSLAGAAYALTAT